MAFTDIFGATTVLPSNPSYLELTIAADVTLNWPVEQQIGGDLVVATIIDLDATSPGLNVDMPNATLVSPGTSVIFNNIGGNTVTVRDSIGGTIISLVSGSVWIAYLTDNTTPEGTWKVFQFGASVSVANAAALAGAGLKAISTTLNTRIAVSAKNANYVIVNSDRAIALVWTSGVGTFDTPNAATVGADWYVIVRNSGNGNLVVTPPTGLIDGSASKTFAPGDSAFIVCDGVDYFTIGFGSGGGGGSGFDFIVIPVPGSGDYTLSGAELGKIGYRFTGILTGTRNIIVPGTTEEYWVDNQTTGAFSLFVKTAAQVPGVEVLQNNRNILYSDGTNVIPAETATVSFPIPVAQGGTGAITAAAARTNLGATVTGAALFTAVDAAAARTAIAAVPTSRLITAGAGLTGGGDLSADRTISLDLQTGSYVTGVFTGSASGSGTYTIGTTTVTWTKVGNTVTIRLGFSQGVSGAGSGYTKLTEVGGNMPAAIRPTISAITMLAPIQRASSQLLTGVIGINTNGNIDLWASEDGNSVFAGSINGLKGPSGQQVSFTYQIN